MVLKRRFEAKKVSVKKVEEKTKLNNKPKLSLVVDNTVYANSSSTNEVQPLIRKLNCYHKISELYQDENFTLFDLMKGLLEIICYGVDAEGGSLWIYDEVLNTLCCKVAFGPGSKEVQDISVPFGKGIVGWVAEKKQSTIVYDAAVDERVSKIAMGKGILDTKSLMASPLIYNKELIGVIEVVNKKSADGKFSDSDRYFLDDLATPAAMHIKNSRVQKNQEDILRRLKTFSELHEKFSSTIDLEPLLQIVLLKAIEILRAEVGSLWMTEESGEGVVCSIAEGPTKDKVLGVKLKKGVGIIGWVVDNNAPIIVEDCSKDSRFSKAVDKKINFETRTMLSVPLSVKGECLGAIQIINKQGKEKYFNQEDLELLMLFASSSSMYIKNAKLYASEKKAKELSALIGISKEITSTLDLDAVLFSIVNLSSQIIPYEMACISVKAKGSKDSYRLSAISGEKSVERDLERNQVIENLHNTVIKGEKKNIYISNLEAETKDAATQESSEPSTSEPSSLAIKDYMGKFQLKSFWAQVLEDDQGNLGILTMESNEKNMILENKQELLSILISQSTVALRNAELYNTIPNTQLIGNFQVKLLEAYHYLKTLSLKQLFAGSVGCVALILGLIFLKVPFNVDANIEILPYVNTFYSHSKGVVKNIYVKEGQRVKRGQLLAELDINDSLIELKQKEYQQQKVMSEMLKSRSERKVADYKIKENELLSLQYEIQLLKKKILLSKVYSNMAGVVIADKLDDLVGMPINFGQELLKVAGDQFKYVQFEVLEEDVRFVKSMQEVKFKVYGHPTKSFVGDIKLDTVSGEGVKILESDPTKYYLAKAKVASYVDQYSVLRPGMTGRGKIYSDWRPLGQIIFGKLVNFFSMKVFFF